MTDSKRVPRVLNRHTDLIPPDAIYVGRGSPWGNPFPITERTPRDLVCDQFRDIILPALDVRALRGKDLVCFCKPKRCHADDLLLKANKEEGQ